MAKRTPESVRICKTFGLFSNTSCPQKEKLVRRQEKFFKKNFSYLLLPWLAFEMHFFVIPLRSQNSVPHVPTSLKKISRYYNFCTFWHLRFIVNSSGVSEKFNRNSYRNLFNRLISQLVENKVC